MKLSIRIPLLFGLVIFVTTISIGFISLQISSSILENNIVNAIGNNNESNAAYLSTTLDGQLNVLSEIANRPTTRTLDWEVIQPILAEEPERIGALDFALISTDGRSRYVIDDTTIDIRDRGYFRKAMIGEKNIDVVFSRVTGNLVVLLVAPIFENNELYAPVIGALAARLDGGKALSDIVVGLKNSLPSGYSYLVDENGTYIAHRETSLVINQFNPIDEAVRNPSLKPLADLTTAALREKNGIYRYEQNGKVLLSHYTEVPGYSWLLSNTIEKNDVDSQINRKRSIILLIGLAMILVGLVFSFFLGKSITKPIANVTHRLKDIAEGDADLTKRINSSSKDEVGELSLYFDNTMEGFRQMIVSIKDEVNVLSDVGGNLSSNMNQTAAAVNEITSNIQSIKGRVMNQSASVSETHATMEQVTGNIDKLNGNIENQSSHISQASAAIEEMVANIHSVTDTLVRNAANVYALREASDVGRAGLQNVATDIQEISRESEGLLEINAVMESIASQTNLLSMNAAIEAAHAGEAGRGFAVVADEIRKLAESSGEQSKTIGTVLKKMKDSIDNITRLTENVLNKFEAIDSGVRIVAEQEDIIRSAMEEQGEGSKQILEGISQVNEITRHVISSSNEMLEGAKEVIMESTNLEKATQEITSGINEMASGADQINTAVHQVNDISSKNHHGIDLLIKEVSRFKVA